MCTDEVLGGILIKKCGQKQKCCVIFLLSVYPLLHRAEWQSCGMCASLNLWTSGGQARLALPTGERTVRNHVLGLQSFTVKLKK